MSRMELEREWRQRLNEFCASGETATAWCAARSINLHRFWYWSRKLRTEKRNQHHGETQWLSVKMEESSVQQESALTVRVGNASIEVRAGFDPALLQRVVWALSHAQ